MKMDAGMDGLLVARAREAETRWRRRTSVREARADAVRRGEPLESDSPTRVAARLNNLVDDVRRSTLGRASPSNPVLKALVERPMPITPEELSREIVNEVVVGARDFLSVEFLERGVVAVRSVGRVVIRSGGDFRARGTGFMVAPELMLTNEHVLTSADLTGRCALEMDYEQNRFGRLKTPQLFDLEPDRFFLSDSALDYALVAVAPRSAGGAELAGYGWLPLIAAQGKISISGDDYLNIVQHPLGREKEVVIRNNRVLDMRTANDEGAEELGPFLHYEADTEKGSSGSAVLNDGWEVVGLHHSGVPATNDAGEWLDKDGGVWREGEQGADRIRWVANEALRVSSLMAALAMAEMPAERRALLDAALSAQAALAMGERTVAEERLEAPASARTAQPSALRPVSASDQGASSSAASRRGPSSATIEIPLTVTVLLDGERATRPMSRKRPRPAGALTEERLEPEDFADRLGFDRDFLDVTLPLPRMKPDPRFGGALVVPRPARPSDRTELRYHNYSVIQCAGRRLAYVSACNLDFAAAATAGRKQGRTTWRTDPRLDAKDQLADRFYAHNDYDKGHLTRRDDTAWGETLEAAIAANDDTFFYTNCAPQHYLFNQADDFTGAGLDLWGDLENHISEQGAAQRARLSVLNGPIFGDADKPLFDALVPLRFYKVVVWRDEGEDRPGAVGFVLDQADLVAGLAEEAIDPGRFSVRQRRIADIEAELDISFGPVTSWDRLLSVERHEALDAAGGIEIAALDDVRL